MKKVLMTITDFTQEENNQLNDIAGLDVIFKDKADITKEDIKNADAVVGNIEPSLLKDENLEWFQSESAGVNQYLNVLDRKCLLTCATGSYGIAISEYMIAMMLNIMKRIPAYFKDQENQHWVNEGRVISPIGKRILVVGTGDIGKQFAKRAKDLGGHIVGMRRREGDIEGFDEMYTIDALKREVALADVIAISLPSSEHTYHLFNKEILNSCKNDAILMNVGRGNVLDTSILKDVADQFLGIWLDVLEEEPLPANSPLWHIDNLYITPHITGGYQLDITLKNLYKIVRHNMIAYASNTEMVSIVDRKWGYAK